jgi:hypothetical protein
MEKDQDFANQLEKLVNLPDSAAIGVTRQKLLSDIEVEENLEVGDVKQKSKSNGSVELEAATHLKAKNIKIGNLTQES